MHPFPLLGQKTFNSAISLSANLSGKYAILVLPTIGHIPSLKKKLAII